MAASATPTYTNGDEAMMYSNENQEKPSSGTSQAKENSSSHHHLHRHHLHNRTNSEKVEESPQPSPKSPKDAKSVSTNAPARRNSWISSISSKFSSTPNAQVNSGQHGGASVAKKGSSPQGEMVNPFGAAFTSGAKEARKLDTATSQPTQSAKSGSFFHTALRRLSSTAPGNLAKVACSGEICRRKTMNVDPYRERCSIPDLEPAKLRKVAFCVDVEIAAPARYIEEEKEPSPPPSGRRPSLTQLENQTDIRKRKDQKLKSSEGETLKNPSKISNEEQNDTVATATREDVGPEKSSLSVDVIDDNIKDSTKKKEKKKRSEEDRKERKERKRKDALANGTMPAELKRGSSCSSGGESQPGTENSQNSQDRPTTDPLRIYRRCCQLRETPILKRITEQIGAPSACPATTPGIISILDLSNYWMQSHDVLTLSDYLAVVPVKKLVLENCGLGDEAVRVILAGVLAAKTSEQAKYNKRLVKKSEERSPENVERLGVIEKISLKNNPKIGRNGWRHIALFLNMSRSIKAIDLSMIPFPETSESPASPDLSNKALSNPKLSTDIPRLLQRALAERRRSTLEELVMAECNLTTEHVEILLEGVKRCGITRVGLANNAITLEGLHHVLRYVQTGKCEGLDLGGNNLRQHLHLLADSLDEKNALYALSLADCSLSASSIEQLLPALVRLPNFRFIDLSHNHDLFTARPSALGLLRKFIPQFPVLKRIHLLDVGLLSEQAIALAEVLPESRSLAHLNILENKPLATLASAKDEESQEEACALYASLMVATRVSSTIVCIDIDDPGEGSSEVVKALAKQVVAYSLRNLERIPLADPTLEVGATGSPEYQAHYQAQGTPKEVFVPDILMHLVGHVDGFSENHDHDGPAPDDDYIVGGTGVVKALGVCINRAADLRKSSGSATPTENGSITPKRILPDTKETKCKAMEMSKNLLSSARKIRARLQPALVKEAKGGNEISFSKLNLRVIKHA